MTARVGILRTEGRTKGIHITERHGKRFDMQLSGNRQKCFLPKEILLIIGIISGCRLKHFTGTLTIISRNDRCMYVYKALILEKFMNRHG